MTERHRWKTVLQYVFGMLALAVCTALAIFIPGLYATWQDENLIHKVTLENRENIEFIDVHSLDLEGRLKILQEAESIGIAEEFNTWTYGVNEHEFEIKVEELIESWYEAGLLPEPPKKEASENLPYYMMSFCPVNIEAGQARLPVYIGRFGLQGSEDVLTVVIDQEKDILYYASVSGNYAMNYMANELGYENADVLKKECLTGDAWERFLGTQGQTGTEEKDYASVCGAAGAKFSEAGEAFEENVELEFETFQGYAYRRIIYSEYGFGVAVMYGTEQWCDVLQNASDWYGFQERRCSVTTMYLTLREEMDVVVQNEVSEKEIKAESANHNIH